ncbi:ATP-binding protein [Gemella cuniculi]
MIIYITFPSYYINSQKEKICRSADIMVEYLKGKSEADITEILIAYSKNINITAHLKKDVANGKLPLVHDLTIDERDHAGYIIVEERIIRTKEDKAVTVQFVVGSNLLQDAIDITLLYLPFTLISTLIFSIIFSHFYSKKLVTPLLHIAKITKKMENMEYDAKFNEDNKDELGEVGFQINKVYKNLLSTIDELEKTNENLLNLQEQKVAFLRGVSHEFKTPLTSVRILLESMKCNVGKYRDHTTYLEKSIRQIDNLNELLKNILESSKFEEWTEDKEKLYLKENLEQIIKRYRELYVVKNIVIHNEVFDDIVVVMNFHALEKILSNVISNAIKYSNKNTEVSIYVENSCVIIDNECDPLNEKELENLFNIFYHSQVVNKLQEGTGVGLYIVKNILESYQMEYSFMPFEKGMRFKINLEGVLDNTHDTDQSI